MGRKFPLPKLRRITLILFQNVITIQSMAFCYCVIFPQTKTLQPWQNLFSVQVTETNLVQSVLWGPLIDKFLVKLS